MNPDEAMKVQRIMREKLIEHAHTYINRYQGLRGSRVTWNQTMMAAIVEVPTILSDKPWVVAQIITANNIDGFGAKLEG
jgi:hypothetical protein